jgi:sulfur-oxidizing protein SoxX
MRDIFGYFVKEITMKILPVLASSLIFLFLVGCDSDTLSARGFSLPDGDAEAGKIVYTRMGCNGCHSSPTIDQLPGAEDGGISVKLGGKVSVVKTYGQLVTSVINPSHRIAQSYAPENTDAMGRSKMRNYNDVMTVGELIDLVSFLESQYELKPYEHSRYQSYYP